MFTHSSGDPSVGGREGETFSDLTRRAISISSAEGESPGKDGILNKTVHVYAMYIHVHVLSQRGDSPFVYRDRGGWPASLPYIRKIRVSVAIGNQSGIRLHERVPMVKIWGSSKNYQNQITGKALKL